MLLRQNVESNPGPENGIKSNVVVRTYNCNGLGNVNKFRRLLIKLKPEVQHGDIFSKERMCRFGMINNNTCERCHEIETTKHLLWGCVESRNIWDLFNSWISNNNSDSPSRGG